jgi:hypothetical protein
MRFPYWTYHVTPTPTLPGGLLSRPEVPLRITGPAGTITLLTLVDSGADETLLPRSIGDAVGAVIDDSMTWPMGGIAGQEVHASPGEVELELTSLGQSCRWTVTVAFVSFSDPADEQAILGHVGCLAFFRATFDGAAGELDIEPASTFPGTIT